MLIDLLKLLTVTGEEKVVTCSYESEVLDLGKLKYPVLNNSKCVFKFKKVKDNRIHLSSTITMALVIPCDRCLNDVTVDFDISDTKEIDIGESSDKRIEALDEMSYVDGVIFDTDKYIYDELVLNLPSKVLCKEDCRGICKKCGKNLNDGECHCDTAELDPRMSKVLDVFNQFKEV